MAFEALEDVREAANCYARAVKISDGNIGPVIYLRELVNRRKADIPQLERIRNEMLEKAVMV